MLYAAAETFAVTPASGRVAQNLLHTKVGQVFTPLKTTVTLIRDDQTTVWLVTTHFMIEQGCVSNLFRNRVAEELGISPQQVLVFSSHNHSDVVLITEPTKYGIPNPEAAASESILTKEGQAFLRNLLMTVRRIRKRCVPVRVAWNVGHERRITYNRKGRRADGSTYLMREDDRIRLGKDFNGDIDDDAPVIAFVGEDDKPVCFLVQFAGHPATDYHPEFPIVHGDFPQVACDDLSEAFGGVPVAFLQGCAGDLQSRGLLAPKQPEEKNADMVRYGHWLGDTYIRTAKRLQYGVADDVAFVWERVRLPFRRPPSAKFLRGQIAEMDDFIRRCAEGDETALTCVGLNAARTMSPRYRSALIEPCRRWAQWALSFHTEGRLASAPRFVELDVAAIRFGDVGLVGLPCEPLLGIGRLIKKNARLPLAVPCGYMNDQSVGYVPDRANNGDMDYQSSFYRYTTSMLPYQDSAGDLLARAGCRMLRGITRRRTNGDQ